MAYTVAFEILQMHFVRCVSQVDEGVAVSPALYDDAARLRVEREHGSVDVARRLHHSAEPPAHFAGVQHLRAKQLEVVLREKLVRAIRSSEHNRSVCFC